MTVGELRTWLDGIADAVLVVVSGSEGEAETISAGLVCISHPARSPIAFTNLRPIGILPGGPLAVGAVLTRHDTDDDDRPHASHCETPPSADTTEQVMP